MNIKALFFMFVTLFALTWLFGNGIESIQKENTQEDVLSNTLESARDAVRNFK